MSDANMTPEFLNGVVDYVEKASSVFDEQEKLAADVEAQAKATLEVLKKQGLAPADTDDGRLLESLCNPRPAKR